jgi:glutathione S-transferase
MLKLYYARPSAYARPVWLALLEKQLSFELIPVDLSGEQFQSEFVAINPFSHVPVLMDGNFRIIESLAILDYLEAQYPEPSLLPTDAKSLATVRMVQLVSFNELLPAMIKFLIQGDRSEEAQFHQRQIMNTLNFLEDQLGDSLYFAGEHLTFAEIVAGTLIYRLPDLDISLTEYPRLNNWCNRLLARSTWHEIELSAQEWNRFKRNIRVMPRIWQRRRHQRLKQASSRQLSN